MGHPDGLVLKGQRDPKPDYMFTYGSAAARQGKPFVRLKPVQMDLSDPALNDLTQSLIDLDGDGQEYCTRSAICHALTIRLTAREVRAAQESIDLFLATDFEAQGFLPRRKAVGKWPAER